MSDRSGVGAHRADLVVDAACELGEGPLYDPTSGLIWWLDVPQHRLHAWSATTTEHRVTPLPRRVSYVGSAAFGGLVTAGDGGVHLIDVSTGAWQLITTLPVSANHVTNDGCVDPHGRLWIGTVDPVPPHAGGRLWIVDSDGRVETARGDVSMSNGVGFSPDGRSAYHVDTRRHTLFELRLDDAGAIRRELPLAVFDTMPDGLAVDVDGGIWVAQWDGGTVERRMPDGSLDDVVSVDGGWITSCVFGRETGLYITSASGGLGADRHAHAGGLFVADVGRPGVPISTFGG
jgi:sugar lactone lactonase YvrE